MGFIDNIKVDRDLQIQTACVAFFLLIFPLYFFTIAAGTDSPAGMGGVGKYTVSGELTYIDFDEGGEYIADGTPLTIDLNTDSLSDMEQEMNIVGVLVSMTYGEDEEGRGAVCQSGTAPDNISATASHLNFSNSADGQNGGGNGGHDVTTEWYNSSMLDSDIEGLSESEIANQLDAKGAGLGDYMVEISVSAQGDSCSIPIPPQPDNEDDGEDVSYTIQLIVLDYTIIPFVDLENI
ncbi:hypothetical protein N9V76_02655 [Candidatus Poseidoniales archaeon]|nr:hypothetical protein [Candidatus Poseidoniales archaeon]